MKKKTLALVLAVVMCVSLLAACGGNETSSTDSAASSKVESTSDASESSEVESTESEPSTGNTATTGANTVVVGTITDTTGDPSYLWENGGSDADVNHLVYGYSTTEMTKEKSFEYNMTVLEDAKETENEDGSKTVAFTLKQDLKWSNGEAITAKDYVFWLLFCAHPASVDLGMNYAADNVYMYDGYEAYANGETNAFKGVRLLGDYEFSLTIAAENMPNYFEKAYLGAKPFYMAGWVPADVEVLDSEDGAMFSENYSAEYVGTQVNDYRFAQNVFSGPYTVDSYDASSLSYTLKKNPNFVGNYEGQTANIETLIIRKVEDETMMDELATGNVDMLLEVMDGNLIVEGLDKVDEGAYQEIGFDRAGYGYVAFKCNFGPTQFVEVRKAIAHLLDRNEFAKQFTGGYGIVVHGPYGTAMWEYQNSKEEMAALETYPVDFDTAEKLLVDSGWTKDENGGEWNGTGLRHKEVDGELMPLQIKWIATENNPVADLLMSMLVNSDNLKKIGMEIVPTSMTFAEMQTVLDDKNQTEYHMFNLASSYPTPVYDVVQTYAIGATANATQIEDQELADLAKATLMGDPEDAEAHRQTWVKFIQRWNELVPQLPLYSNTYFDFYSNKIQNYTNRDPYWSFRYEILYATVEE